MRSFPGPPNTSHTPRLPQHCDDQRPTAVWSRASAHGPHPGCPRGDPHTRGPTVSPFPICNYVSTHTQAAHHSGTSLAVLTHVFFRRLFEKYTRLQRRHRVSNSKQSTDLAEDSLGPELLHLRGPPWSVCLPPRPTPPRLPPEACLHLAPHKCPPGPASLRGSTPRPTPSPRPPGSGPRRSGPWGSMWCVASPPLLHRPPEQASPELLSGLQFRPSSAPPLSWICDHLGHLSVRCQE